MKCNEFLEHLNQYIDNDLPEDKRIECQEHLAQCENCKNVFEEEKEINEMFTEAMNQEEVVFESRIDNVMASIDKEKYSKETKVNKVVDINSRKKSKIFNKKIAGLAAVCAMCLYLAPGVLQSSSKDMAANNSKPIAFEAETNSDEKEYGNVKSAEKATFSSEEQSARNNKGGDVMSAENYDEAINEENPKMDDTDTTKEIDAIKTATVGDTVEETSNDAGVSEKDKAATPTPVTVKAEEVGKTAVPGKDADKDKLMEMLDKDEYLANNFGIKVVIERDRSYIDNNGKQESFGMKFGINEMFIEDDDFVYIIYRGTRESDEKIVSKILKFEKANKEMKEIYEVNTPEIIESLKIEEDGLVYTIRYKNKIKSMKIEK